jgi:hypothetical protein
MKGYIFSIILFLLSLQGMGQKKKGDVEKGVIKKDTFKVQYEFMYDTGCTYGALKTYDKNGKPMVFSYDNVALSKIKIKKSKH